MCSSDLTLVFGLMKEMWQRPIHLCFVLVLVFLLYPATSRGPKDRIPWYDYLWAALSAFVTLYMVTQFYGPMLDRAGMPERKLVFRSSAVFRRKQLNRLTAALNRFQPFARFYL